MINKITNINMTWIKVIVMAVAAGALTAVIMLIPALENTSIHNIGVCFEFWFVPAVLIGINCKKPIEAGLKVFVFFLISQPLVYLIQVPFSWLGWQLFNYYRYWFIWTLLMIPGGVAVWFGRQKKWMGIIDAIVASAFLIAVEFISHFRTVTDNFPKDLLTLLFIVFEVVALFIIYIFDKNNGKTNKKTE